MFNVSWYRVELFRTYWPFFVGIQIMIHNKIMFLYSLFVSDQTNDAVFVAFGIEMVKLTNIQASEADHILVCHIFGYLELHTTLPHVFSFLNLRCLGFAGCRCQCWTTNSHSLLLILLAGPSFFQLKLGEVNFSPKQQTFTISCINLFWTPGCTSPRICYWCWYVILS